MASRQIKDHLEAVDIDPLWDSSTTASFLGVPEQTLNQWSYRGIGPVFSKIGRYRRYRRADVEAYVDANRRGGDAGGTRPKP